LPLPFGGPPKAKPIPKPVAKPIPRGPAVRAKLVADGPADNPYAPPAERDATAAEAARRRQVREQLADIEAAEEARQEEYDDLLGRCGYARTGLHLLAFGSLAGCLAAVCYSLFVMSTLTKSPQPPIAMVGGFFLVLAALLTAAGFGAAAAGPRQTLGTALMGLAVTALHVGLTLAAAVILLNLIRIANITYGADTRQFVADSLLLANAFSNLSVLADLPVYLLTGIPDRPALLVLPAVGGALEFARLSLMGILANRFAAEGKDGTLAHDAMRIVNRIFGVVLVAGTLKIGAYVLSVLLGGDPLQQNGFAIGLLMLTNGYFLWWAFACFAQFQTLKDVAEVVTADRFVDSRNRLEV
jgi:hypothetical protein